MPAVPPDPTVLHPMPGQPRVVLLKPLITSPLIEVGEFSYYDDPDDPTAFETRNVLYHYGPEKLVIGKFCALGEGVRFIMDGANHRMDGPSTFPFPIMGGSWAEHFDLITGLPGRGDTDIERLLALAWWDWPLQHITDHIRTIMSGSIDDLENAAPPLPHG
ncbi:antibiotic acetyltransferase [Microbispora hainanensis]|uniref:antibiotic acetyltransferase n=1 Tax=Microbispora hainanensis TaxID=568844 RepID=UPI0033F34A68